MDYSGSVVATVLWVLLSLAFRVYISYFGNYNETYGAVGAVIVLLTWRTVGPGDLLGAELNPIEHASPTARTSAEGAGE